MNKICEKLSFYFEQPKENFIELAKKNPMLDFKEMIQKIKEIKIEEEKLKIEKKKLMEEEKKEQLKLNEKKE